MLHQAGFEPTEAGAEFYSIGSGETAARQAVDTMRLAPRRADPTHRTLNPPDLNAEKYLPEIAKTQDLAKQLIT